MRRNKYELYDCEVVNNTKSFDRCKFYMVKRVVNRHTYYDIAMECDNFVFVMQPKEFYSAKTHYIFEKMLHAIAKDMYSEAK